MALVFYLLTVMRKIDVPLLGDFASFHSLTSNDNRWTDRHQIPTPKLVYGSINASEPSLSLHSESYVILSNSFQKRHSNSEQSTITNVLKS